MQADAHPELTIFQPVDGVLEIRVYNKDHLRVHRGICFVKQLGLLCALLLMGLIHAKMKYPINYYLTSLFTLLYVYNQCTQVIYESVQLIASYGIQLETVRGVQIPFFSPIPLTSQKRFISLPFVKDIIINEGLRGWNVRYYLCIIKDTQAGVTLEVIFENLLPKLPVLEIVYRNIHKNWARKIS